MVIIGSGNVAHLFASHWGKRHQIVQVISRHLDHAQTLAQKFHATTAGKIEEVMTDADLYLLAVSDDALPKIAAKLRVSDQLVIHSSGYRPMAILHQASCHTGVIYPLQTIRKGVTCQYPIPLLIEASDPETRKKIRELAQEISAHVYEIDSHQRKYYHLAAVFANNFVYHLLSQVNNFCDDHQISFAHLFPLMQETLQRVKDFPAFTQQTGPARRNDLALIQEHLIELEPYPDIQEIYKMFTQQILKRYSS